MSRLRCPAVANLLAVCLLLNAGAACAQSRETAVDADAQSRGTPAAVTPSDAAPAAAMPERIDAGERAPEAADPDEVDVEAEDAPEDVDSGDASEPTDPAEPAVGTTHDATEPATGVETTTVPDATPPAMTRGPKKQVYGWIEDVLIDPRHALKLPAKLDTGADTTSLDARNIRRSRRDGEDYVRFVVTEPVTGQSVELEKPFVRAVRIKGHGNTLARRVVVRMRVCIGDRSRSIEVNLVDRAHFEFPLLLGRNALRDVAVIDPNLRRTREPSCWEAADSWASAPPSDATEPAGGATTSCESAPMC